MKTQYYIYVNRIENCAIGSKIVSYLASRHSSPEEAETALQKLPETKGWYYTVEKIYIKNGN